MTKSILIIIQDALDHIKDNKGSISDGYHTFDELYEFRKLYNALLFNAWGNVVEIDKFAGTSYTVAKHGVHKSWRHSDGELCFGGGWFIIMATLPSGQISNHYKAEDWDLFKVPERENADVWDGHTSADVLKRLKESL